jgi:predicted thioesterase
MAVESFPEVKVGLEGRTERVLDEALLTRHVGGKGVFATPAMIGLMEMTAHGSLESLIPDGYTTVGYEVHVRHLAPSQPGTTVIVTTKVTSVEGRKVTFEVACYDGEKLVGSGIHKRAIVPTSTE